MFAANALERTEHIEGVKTKRHKMGGWSQARYQRHTENYHIHHAKEVVDALARVVRDESIRSIVMSGDDVIVPLLKEQLPKDLAERIVDVVKLDVQASEREVLEKTIAALRENRPRPTARRLTNCLGPTARTGSPSWASRPLGRRSKWGEVDELIITAPKNERPTSSSQKPARPRRRFASSRTLRCCPRSAVSARFCDTRSDELTAGRTAGRG